MNIVIVTIDSALNSYHFQKMMTTNYVIRLGYRGVTNELYLQILVDTKSNAMNTILSNVLQISPVCYFHSIQVTALFPNSSCVIQTKVENLKITELQKMGSFSPGQVVRSNQISGFRNHFCDNFG